MTKTVGGSGVEERESRAWLCGDGGGGARSASHPLLRPGRDPHLCRAVALVIFPGLGLLVQQCQRRCFDASLRCWLVLFFSLFAHECLCVCVHCL